MVTVPLLWLLLGLAGNEPALPPCIAILAQTNDLHGCVGEEAIFSVSATGSTTLAYEWRKDCVPIPGQDQSTFIIDVISIADFGTYSCVVSNSCGSYTVSNMTLTPGTVITIDEQPQNQAVVGGFPASFSVVASGSDLNYQWRKDCIPLEGATSSTLTIAETSVADIGTYSCEVYNDCAVIVSEPATLMVTTNSITFLTQPQDVTVCFDNPAVLSVSVTGLGPFTYQWYFGKTPLTLKTQTTLTLEHVGANEVGEYFCRASNDFGYVDSDVAQVNFDPPAEFQEQPLGSTGCSGDLTTLHTAGTGIGTLQYQWYRNAHAVSGGTSASLQVTLSPSTIGTYYCKLTDDCGAVFSQDAVLALKGSGNFTTEVQNLSACVGEGASFSVVPEGEGPFTYQWRKDCVPIPDATSSSYTIEAVTIEDTGTYTCAVSSDCFIIMSEGSLIVREPVEITVQPSAPYTCANQEVATLEITVADPEDTTYQWYRNQTLYAHQTERTLDLYGVIDYDGDSFYCIVTNSCGSVTSETTTFLVSPALLILSQPENLTTCAGITATFSVTVSGTEPLSYQWRKDCEILADATEPTLQINDIDTTDQGMYSCTISNLCGSVMTEPAALILTETCMVSIPDIAFRNFLLAGSWLDEEDHSFPIDQNSDGTIDSDEALAVTGSLDCSQQKIKDLTGIGFFANLKELNCSFNKLKELPLEINLLTGLLDLNASYNNLHTYPDLHDLVNLVHLDLSHNHFDENNPRSTSATFPDSVEDLNLSGNNLTRLPDLSNLTGLRTLHASNNRLSELATLLASNSIGTRPGDVIDLGFNIFEDCASIQALLDRTGQSGANLTVVTQLDLTQFADWPNTTVLGLLNTYEVTLECSNP